MRGESRTAIVIADSQRSKHKACFACVNQVLLILNYDNNVTSGKLIHCLKCFAGTCELVGFNHIYVFHEVNSCKKKSKDSFKVCFENVNIVYNGFMVTVELITVLKVDLWFQKGNKYCIQPNKVTC